MNPPLVDTHRHAWDFAQFSYRWCSGIPALNRSFTLRDYAAEAAGLGIGKSVFMECDVDEPHALAEAQAVQAAADQLDGGVGPRLAGIVASGRPEREGFEEHLDALLRLPLLRGLRRILHTQPDELSRAPRFAENVRRLAAHRLTFDVCVLARQLPLATALARACPEVTFILDHCGVPEVKARVLDPWRAEIKAIAALPNVHCKISGLVAYADPTFWTAEDLRPFFEHVIACFGWDRVVWGSDWPVCTLAARLRQWVEATHTLVQGASPAERQKLFHRNAERIYRV